jgi:peptide-methionine (S)-S-oxide reductase
MNLFQKPQFLFLVLLAVSVQLSACGESASSSANSSNTNAQIESEMSNTSSQVYQSTSSALNEKRADDLAEATFGSGCFWCTEAYFERLEGVKAVISGYSGGHVKNASYKQVCSGLTGHAEVTRIVYDPAVISFAELLEVFWATHDPTTLNRQGNDVGTQYRSVIFYHDEEQKQIAELSLQAAEQSGAWSDPIVTEISPLINWIEAEKEHQDFFENNPYNGYCQVVLVPKLEKFKKTFADKLKDSKK